MEFYKVSNDQSLCHYGIMGMKWGVRRFQNADGSLTTAGKARYGKGGKKGGIYEDENHNLTPRGEKRLEKERLKNLARKKENRMDEEAVRDTKRWERDDLVNTRDVLNKTNDILRSTKELDDQLKRAKKKKNNKRMDLSNMTDKEMRDKINRENLERQYNELFNDKEAQRRGKANVREALDLGGTILALASSAVSIAIALKG